MRYTINFSRFDRRRAAMDRRLLVGGIVAGAALFVLLVAGVNRAAGIGKETERVRGKKIEIEGKIEKMIVERRKHISDEEVAALEKRQKFYAALSGDRLYMTTFFNVLEEQTPSSIVLKSVDFDSERKNFIITGESINPEAVAQFIPKLQSAKVVGKVEITRQTFQRLGDKKILVSEFEIRGEVR